MKSWLKVSVALFALVLASGSAKAATTAEVEGVMKDMIGVFAGLGDTLETVKDKASAEAANPKLKELGAKMQEITKKMDEMKPTTEQEKELESHKPKFEAAMEKFSKEMGRIQQQPELAAALLEGLQALQPKQ